MGLEELQRMCYDLFLRIFLILAPSSVFLLFLSGDLCLTLTFDLQFDLVCERKWVRSTSQSLYMVGCILGVALAWPCGRQVGDLDLSCDLCCVL